MNLWDVKALFYSVARKPWPLNSIHKKETEIIKLLLHQVTINNPKVLDVGCGVGHSTALLNPEWNTIAVDKSKKMLHQARSFNRGLVAADATALPFNSQTFDLIACIGLSEYIEDLDALLFEMFSLLRDGGFLLMTSSPESVFCQLRNIGGSKIHTRNAESVLSSASAFLKPISQVHFFSMDAFLFQADINSK